MANLDYLIVLAYFVILAGIGVALARRAGRSGEHYFLGGRAMPWWALGASGMASNLDVAGTMTLVGLFHLYGLQGFFVEMRGGVVLPIAVFLAFMGKWHRRSAVMTTAEWMLLRFGEGAQGRAARLMAALAYLVITVAMTVFFFTASGRFLAELLPFTPLQCTLGMAVVALGYALAGGLYGVVWTDVFQAGIIGAAAIYVGVVASGLVTPELLAAWPGSALNSLLPRADGDPALAPYEAFGWFLLVWAGKGVLEGLGGSAGSAYMAQRYYAARTDWECRKIAMLWTVLFAFRWPLVLGFAVLAVKLGIDATAPGAADTLLSQVLLSDYFPVGVRGLVVAAMLAAAMSTFDSTINAGASYLVRDVYEVWRGRPGSRERVWAGYFASLLIVALGLAVALTAGASVIDVWVGIVMLLFPAFLVPFALRWYWARFNGAGFALGVAAGFGASLFVFLREPAGWNEAARFGFIATASALVSVAGALLTRAVPAAALRAFYDQVGPFGWWPRDWKDADRAEHRADLLRLPVALLWQILTFLIPMGAMLGLWSSVLPAVALWAGLFVILLRGSRETKSRQSVCRHPEPLPSR